MSHRFTSPPVTRISGLLRFLVLTAVLPVSAAQAAGLPIPASVIITEKLPLARCIELALTHQPRLAASRASLASAEKNCQGLEALLVPEILVPELPFRRTQSALGLTIARASLAQTQRQATYAVTRAYFTVVYSRNQERLAEGVVAKLDAVRAAAKQMLDAGAREVSSTDVERSLVYVRLAQTRQSEARQGVKRALAALKETIGAGPLFRVDVSTTELPHPRATPSLDEIRALALAHREELVMADAFARIVCAEANAQATSCRKRMETFAAASDIHAHQVPQESHDGSCRPGAISPEMPSLLIGSRTQRVDRAKFLHKGAMAGIEVARNLITLEAEDAVFRWQQASEQARQSREAADAADKLAENLRQDFIAMQKVRVEEVTTAQVLAATARGQHNEFLYKKIVALAELERITAGQFLAGLVDAPAAVLPVPAPKENGDRPAK